MHVNAALDALHKSYLFSQIAHHTDEYLHLNPGVRLLHLGVGDVSRPLAPAIVRALCSASEEMGDEKTFRGYGPYQGYAFLREEICHTYRRMNAPISPQEIFVSDGAKGDCAAMTELLSPQSIIAICDPVYPVYSDANRMAGKKVIRIPCRSQNGFLPEFPKEIPDAVYLCSPNNPTGVAFSRDFLSRWVDWARENDVLLLYDAAYRDYIRSPHAARSLFEIPGAEEIGIEFGSFSKGAGFTGLRCGWAVIPQANRWNLHDLWSKRQSTKTNGVSYPVQRAALSALTDGAAHCAESVAYYMQNAQILKKSLKALGFSLWGGEDAPYLWIKTPQNQSGWQWFEHLLYSAQIVCTPGEGFGAEGAGYVRFSALGKREEILLAAERLKGC